MTTRIVEEVVVEDLVDGLMEAKMMIKRTRMRLEVVAKTRGKITQIISVIKIIEIREEEEEGKELEEEAYQFSLKVEENLKQKYDNKNSGRGCIRTFGG